MPMNVNLTPYLEKMVREKVSSGLYTSASEVIREALRLMDEQDSIRKARIELLRQEILGPEAFDDAFRTYTKRWAFKHPTPADFFRTMEDVGGRRLDWFFREWFIENPHFDQGVDDVSARSKGDTTQYVVAFGNHARGVLPIRARFTFSDGTTTDYNYPAEVWSTNTVRYVRQYTFTGKKVVRIELDPDNRWLTHALRRRLEAERQRRVPAGLRGGCFVGFNLSAHFDQGMAHAAIIPSTQTARRSRTPSASMSSPRPRAMISPRSMTRYWSASDRAKS